MIGPHTLSVTSNTEELDCDKDDEEDGDPDSDIDVGAPEIDGEAGSDEFERQDNEPGDGIVPSNGKPPGHVRVRDAIPLYHRSHKKHTMQGQ